MIINAINYVIKAGFRRLNLEIRRIPDASIPPPLLDNPFDVVAKINSHEAAALNCPVNLCIAFNGMSFSKAGWNPFVHAAQQYIGTGRKSYSGSSLEKYYESWRPKNGRDALIGAVEGPKALDKEPSYIKHIPWSCQNLRERVAYMRHIIALENKVFGNEALTFEHGYGLHGPVSYAKGELEYRRLIELTDSIKRWGFDRWRGDINIEVLRRDNELRYLVTHGHHRIAVMAALGYECVPANPLRIIDVGYAEHWEGVYKGIWSKDEAIRYFNHLFDFDSTQWASMKGLR